MAKLFVVRHAQVTVDFGIPASEWQISAEGIEATKNLALSESWNEVNRIYHSRERKAVATASIIREITGIPTSSMKELCELSIPLIQPEEEFVRRVGAYLGGFNDQEFEDWNEATTRIVEAVNDIIQASNGASAVLVSHGRILSVLFSHILKRRVTVNEWRSIQLPDLSVVDLDTWTVERGFFSALN